MAPDSSRPVWHPVGRTRCAVLRSWGIDTAADVEEDRISDIAGFGRSLTDKLVIWRAVKEKAFVYNAAAIADPLGSSASIGSSPRAGRS
jgi:DNA-binding helix-hairpin-helix protein with protein kinase domain